MTGGTSKNHLGIFVSTTRNPPAPAYKSAASCRHGASIRPSVHDAIAYPVRSAPHSQGTSSVVSLHSSGSSHSPHSPHRPRSEEHTSELQSRGHLVCRLLLEKNTKCQPLSQ